MEFAWWCGIFLNRCRQHQPSVINTGIFRPTLSILMIHFTDGILVIARAMGHHEGVMRAVIQRVLEASVTIDGQTVSRIGPGLLVLLGVEEIDNSSDVEWLSAKIAKMRIFSDADGKMNLSVLESGGKVLVVSQFTLHASTKKGNRPSFIRAAAPGHSEPLYVEFCNAMERETGSPVARGVFGGDMKISLVNDGPVTIVIDTRARE
jgi:D-tyrosyl-tRNA(Tyr) deacylase